MVDRNLLLEYDNKNNKINKRCKKCKYAYENRRRRFKYSHPGQPYDPSWVEPRYKKCRKGKHLMTPANTKLVGKDRDKRCYKCYKAYDLKYKKKWQLWKLYR